MLRFFRTLFPSWRFFTQLTPIPKIFYRIALQDNSFSEWTELPLYSRDNSKLRSWKRLFHNPDENLYLCSITQIEVLLNDIAQNTTPVIDLTSYNIVYPLIENKILELHPQVLSYEFKIGALIFKSSSFHTQPQWTESFKSSITIEA